MDAASGSVQRIEGDNLQEKRSRKEQRRDRQQHYEELEKVGLAAPQVTYIMHALKSRGLDVDADATTIEEATNEILKALGSK